MKYCCYCFIVIVVNVFLVHNGVVVVDPRNLPLKLSQNWVINRWDVVDVVVVIVIVVVVVVVIIVVVVTLI